MAVDCDPNVLMARAECIDKCVPSGMEESLLTYLYDIRSGLNLSAEDLLLRSSCLRHCVPDGMVGAIQSYLLSQTSPGGGGGGSPIYLDWIQRIVAAGGTEPSDNTKLVINSFATALATAGLDTKMKALNCMVPDSLIACRTPLIATYGHPVWLDHSGHEFQLADLTVDGLKGGGQVPEKHLDTGVNASTCFASENTGGVTIYNTLSDTSVQHDFGCYNISTSAFHFLVCYDAAQQAYFDCYSTGTGRISGAGLAGGLGYTSGNRTAANATAIYKASGAISHSVIVTGVNAPGDALPNTSLPFFCVYDGLAGGSYKLWTAKRFSFCAIHDGLTQSESATLFSLVQPMRVALGGGYV
jgi:hypothetical protein